MTNKRRIRWKFGILAGLAVVLVTMIPQLSLWIERGTEGHGAFAIVDPDELAYSGYINSIVNGKSRRNDPFLGGATTTHETYFSIQFVPAYTLAFVARIFRTLHRDSLYPFCAAVCFLIFTSRLLAVE